jgi:hypothetical protein
MQQLSKTQLSAVRGGVCDYILAAAILTAAAGQFELTAALMAGFYLSGCR